MTNKSEPPSPVARRDLTDPGDATGRNFRYQYAYGVILLAGAARHVLDYQAIWCEQHEDFIGEVNQNLFDAYQIKTQQPENGWWQHNSEPYSKSIARFVKHEINFPGKIRRYCFVSNAKPLETTDQNKIYQSPCQLLRAVSAANDYTELTGENKRGFEYLIGQAALKNDDREALFGVLRRLDFPDAPDRNTFITAVAHEHISKLDDCDHLNATQLNRVAEHLLNLVASASSLGSQDPSRHYAALSNQQQLDVQLQHKRVNLDAFCAAYREIVNPAIAYPPELSTEPLLADIKRLEIFRRKLKRGGFEDDEMEAFRRQTILAHGKLFELATRDADGEDIVREIENLVLDECNAAKIATSNVSQAAGKEMYLKLRQELQAIATEQSPRVKRLPYEVLMGMAGLLTEDCTVWWSDKFDLTKDS